VEIGCARETVSRLLSRAKRNLRRAGLDPERALDPQRYDLMEMAG
jgi:hypothetical protein